ncbi:uncharacterized protein LOC142357077 [Convolutriloba macropyga]|uniref:uncharacterized protein LOC142357077 n=1 Tax=Convolutriloba macropyga TaxID=536237 RepID=UPI003F528A0F
MMDFLEINFKKYRKYFKCRTVLLLLSVLLTLGFVVLCVVSAIYSLIDLSKKLDTLVTEVTMQKVSQYDAPALIFLSNGVFTYSCIASAFRVDPQPTLSDFDNHNIENVRSQIQDVCNETSISYQLTLGDLNEFGDVISEFPDWLVKNIVTTIPGSAQCLSGNSDDKKRQRSKRDSADDLDKCDGGCHEIWECSNDPQTCENSHLFEQCFNPQSPLKDHEPCLTTKECVSGPPVLKQSCSEYLKCLHEDYVMERECEIARDCFLVGQKETGYCYEFFQCMEDQIEPKCLDLTTIIPLYGFELERSCSLYSSVVKDDKSLAKQKNDPLRLIIVKGPVDYSEKNYVFASMRLQSKEAGLWVAEHPNFNELSQIMRKTNKFQFLLDLVQTLKWKMYSRGFRAHTLLTQFKAKIEGVTKEMALSAETVMTRVNISKSLNYDYRPVEVVYSWKDGYLQEMNRYISVSVWDTFAIIAGIILMLDRAWSTWGRVVQKFLAAKTEVYMMKYEKDSSEYAMLQAVKNSGTNLLTSTIALKRLDNTFTRISRMDQKRTLLEQRTNEKIERKINKIKKKMAIRSGIVDESVIDNDIKRVCEWKSYRSILRKMLHENDARQAELDRMEADRVQRLMEAELQSRWNTRSTDPDDATSRKSKTPESNTEETAPDVSAKPLPHAVHMKEMKRKKQKRFQATNPNFEIDDKFDYSREIFSNDLDSGEFLWSKKVLDKRAASAFSTRTNLKEPSQWKNEAFQENV